MARVHCAGSTLYTLRVPWVPSPETCSTRSSSTVASWTLEVMTKVARIHMGVDIYPQMQLTPLPVRSAVVLTHLPLAFAEDFQPHCLAFSVGLSISVRSLPLEQRQKPQLRHRHGLLGAGVVEQMHHPS